MIGADVPGNYALQSLGPDALLGTPDDEIIPVSVTYSNLTATLSFAPLPASVYRLTLRNPITDPNGNPLDGDADWTPGPDWTRDFVVPASAALFGDTHTLTVDPSTGLRRVAVGDFNGDGKPDLVTANLYTSNVSLLFGHGDGTFMRPVTYASGGSNPQGLAVGDFNGDGHDDLAVGNCRATPWASSWVTARVGFHRRNLS